jgi:hypothetical protein
MPIIVNDDDDDEEQDPARAPPTAAHEDDEVDDDDDTHYQYVNTLPGGTRNQLLSWKRSPASHVYWRIGEQIYRQCYS